MMARKFLSAVVLAGAVGLTFSAQIQEYCQFLPDNDMYIPVEQVSAFGGLTQENFNSVIDRIEAIYTDDITARGGQLVINRLWDDGTVNASAQRMGNKFILNMYGGLARNELVTVDGFAAVLCHEMGHQVGGAPKVGNWMMKWAANEGQSDYFATLKCLRRYFAKDDNERIVASLEVPQIVTSSCANQFADRSEQLICMRGAMAGLSVSSLLASLSGSSDIDFATPDTREVRKTYNAHPKAQCRLDTYLAGAVCNVSASTAVSDTDFKVGTCWDTNVSKEGLRPRCWFQPAPTWWERWKNRKKGGGSAEPTDEATDKANDQYEDGINDGIIH
jgi:hypothetical protein